MAEFPKFSQQNAQKNNPRILTHYVVSSNPDVLFGNDMRIAYFDCFPVRGDMIVAAMLDAGLDAAMLRSQLATLGLEFELAISSGNSLRRKSNTF